MEMTQVLRLEKSVHELFLKSLEQGHTIHINKIGYLYYQHRPALTGTNPQTKLAINIPEHNALQLCPDNSKGRTTIDDPKSMFTRSNIKIDELDLGIDFERMNSSTKYLITDVNSIKLFRLDLLTVITGKDPITYQEVAANTIIHRILICKDLQVYVQKSCKPFITLVFGENPDKSSDSKILTEFKLIR